MTGNLEINTWASGADADGDSMARWEVQEGGLLDVGGKFWLTNKQKLVVDGGAVSAGSMHLGHDQNQGSYYSKVVLTGGSITTGNFTFIGAGNAVTMTGGALTFAPGTDGAEVLVDGKTSNSNAGAGTISFSGGKLAATTSGWSMTGTSNLRLSLGDVTLDIAAGKTVTLGGSYDLTGTLSLIGNTVEVDGATSTGTLALTGTMNITSLQNLKQAEGQHTGGSDFRNGFSGYYYLVQNTDSATLNTNNLTVTLGGASNVVTEKVSVVDNHLVISGSNDIFYVNAGSESATDSTMATDGFVRYHVEKDANLVIDISETFSESNRNSVLTSTTGTGALVLNADATFGLVETVFQGDIKVANGSTLKLGELVENQANAQGTPNVSSLRGIVLDGGNLVYQGSVGTIQSISALSNADFSIYDMTSTDNQGDMLSVGNVFVADGMTMTVNGIAGGVYKHHLSIGQLSGQGDLTVYGSGNTEWKVNQASRLTISSLKDFTGNLSITCRENEGNHSDGHAVYHATVNTGADGATLGSLQFIGFGQPGESSTAEFNVQGNTSVSLLDIASGTVNLASGTTLTLGGSDTTTVNHTIGTLTSTASSKVSISKGANLTLTSLTGVNGDITGEGSLTLQTGAQTHIDNYTHFAHPIFGSDLNTLVLSGEGTGLQIHSSQNNQPSNFGKVKNIIVNDGATLYHRLIDNDLNQRVSISLAGDGNGSATGAALSFGESCSRKGTLKLKELFNVSLADDATILVAMHSSGAQTGEIASTLQGAGHTLTKIGGGTLKLLDGANNASLNVQAGVLELGGAATTSEHVELSGGTLKLGQVATINRKGAQNAIMTKAQMSSTGIASTTEGTMGTISNADIEIAQLAQDASFTIADMTLTNTSITAATVNTQVSFDNVTVSGAVVLKNLKVSMSDAQVAAGGSEGSKGIFTGSTTLLSGITMNAGSSLTVDLGDLSSYAAMGPGKYDLSITLSGFSMADFEGAYADSALQFAADSWLGQLLAQSNNAGVQITIAQAEAGAAAADAGGASTGVSYSTGNVGTIITINGLNVPEPTTSTLSLLALAALAARRRRKM